MTRLNTAELSEYLPNPQSHKHWKSHTHPKVNHLQIIAHLNP